MAEQFGGNRLVPKAPKPVDIGVDIGGTFTDIVCRRAGLHTRSAEYLSSFVEEETGLESISLDLVSRAAARIEEMGQRSLPPRKETGGG